MSHVVIIQERVQDSKHLLLMMGNLKSSLCLNVQTVMSGSLRRRQGKGLQPGRGPNRSPPKTEGSGPNPPCRPQGAGRPECSAGGVPTSLDSGAWRLGAPPGRPLFAGRPEALSGRGHPGRRAPRRHGAESAFGGCPLALAARCLAAGAGRRGGARDAGVEGGGATKRGAGDIPLSFLIYGLSPYYSCMMANNKMEMRETARYKPLRKMISTSEPFQGTGVEVSPLKKFTIPKIRRTAEKVDFYADGGSGSRSRVCKDQDGRLSFTEKEKLQEFINTKLHVNSKYKVYLSPCYTNTREFGFIHDTLNQSRLDISCELQTSWQFGDTKLVHNEDLEKKFTSKRSEMRESGRHGRELEEHFCFLALPQSDVTDIYRNGMCTKASSLKILGNPLLGIYIFRHVDVALNYAHSRSITVESIIIFKVYLYEYNVLSKPVDKPRQCLPYAIITVKFIGQKTDNGHLMPSLRFLSTGFPKRTERTCSLNNCTVAKRIGKGKDATVIFEHFRKPVDPFVQENCSCSTLNSDMNPSNSNISSSYGNVQSGNISILETYNGEMEHNLAESQDKFKARTYDSGLSFIPSDNKDSINGDLLLNLTHLKNVLSSISAAFPLQNNIDSSTVITSKLIKDPRLMRREESMGKHNNFIGLNEILPFEKNLDFVNSEINLSSMPTNSVSSSEIVPDNHAILPNCLGAPCFKISFDDSQPQAHNMDSKDNNYTTANEITMVRQCEDQDNFSFPMCLSNVVSENEIQNCSDGKKQKSQQWSNNLLLIEQNSEPHDSCESVNTCMKKNNNPISQEAQSSHLNPVYQTGYHMSTLFPLQRKENTDEYIQNRGKMRNLTGAEGISKHGEKQKLWKEIDNCFTNETKVNPVDRYISLCKKYPKNEILDSLRENCDHILTTEELEIPQSSMSTVNSKYKVDHLSLELQNDLTPREENLQQKYPQYCLEYEDSVHISFAISQKLMELALEKSNQNYFNIVSGAFQEGKGIPQDTEPLVSSHNIKRTYENSDCNIAKENRCVQRKNENEPMSLENIQRNCKGQDHTLFCNAQLNSDKHLNVNFKEQVDNGKENQNKTKDKDIALSEENNIENIYEDEKQGFHINQKFTNLDEKNKNYNSVEILNSEAFSTTFNLTWEKCVPAISALFESEDVVTAIKPKDSHNTRQSVEHMPSTIFPEIAVSSVYVTSNTAVQITGTAVPVLSTNPEDHQGHQFKETCSSQSKDYSLLIKHRVSDCAMDMDKNELYDSLPQSINDNLLLQSFEIENEIEIESEVCDDTFPLQQDTLSNENVLYEEVESSYEALKSRIDWEGLFGNNGETEVLQSTTKRENSDQHYFEESNCCFSSAQKNKANPILLPDLQVSITNIFVPRVSPTVKCLALKDNFCKCITEAITPAINEEEQKVPVSEINSQCSGENSDYPCEKKFGNIRQESVPESESEILFSFDLSHKTHINHINKKQNGETLLPEPSNVTTIKNENRCDSAESKTDGNDTRNKKDTDSRNNKRKPHTSFKDQNIPQKDVRYHEICGKKRKLTCQDSSECFASLSQGRIKTFSQSEKHIRNVLDILNSEVSLCKSKRLSRKLDRAVLHLKKAHRRVHTSLQLIAKVGEKSKSPLPKSYAIICNNFWESCDLQGYSSVSERRYYSTKHFLSKRKYDKPGEKRALGFEVDKSLTHASKHKFYKTNRERLKRCLPKDNLASSVSRSQTTIHVREFFDQMYSESQLPLCSTSQSTSQSANNNGNVKNTESLDLQPFSGKSGHLISSVCPDDKLTEKENQIDIKVLSNNKYEELENNSACNIKGTTKENNSETIEVINKNSLSDINEHSVSFSTDKNCDTACIAHTKVKTNVLISVLEPNVKHFLNVDICKPENLILTDFKRNVEVEKSATPVESSKPGIITGNVTIDPINLTLVTSKMCGNIPQLLSVAPVIDSKREFSKSYLDEQRIFAVDSFVTSTTIPHYQQECSGQELLKTKQCSSDNCFHVDTNDTNVIENSKLDLTPITEESKNCGENRMRKLFSNDTSLLLKDNIKGSCPQKCILEKDIQNKKTWKVKHTEKTKNLVDKRSLMGASTVKTEYKNQKNKILEGYSCLSEKAIKNNLTDSHLTIKNTTETISFNSTISDCKREEGVKFSHDSLVASTLFSETASNSKPGIIGINHMPVSQAHSETSKATTQKRPTSQKNEFKEKHCLADHSAPVARLTHILRRADEASSLQSLQEETKVCQNILPLFVEAFERKQECSLEQTLISRELLVEQNLWSNCKQKLKPCAVDSLVELQMMMETIQFIENKKRLLGGEPTFRSLLWYDDTLYSELLGRPRGFQQQSSFYPGFQGRLKYNAFCELQNYHDQLVELFEETKRENNSHYAVLKYKRQINECEAIMKHCSDCFDFSLSVPFTCGVNFGDSLGDLETLRKSTLKLISMYGDSPKGDSYPGKQDHLWIIIEMISSKVNFIKSTEAVSIKISLYGFEHIFFDAAKSLVWKERRQSFSRNYPGKKNKEMLLKMNQCAFSKLQKIYDTLSKDLSSSNNGFKENTVIASRKSDNLINKPTISLENYRFNNTFSHPDICCVSEILDQAQLADFKKLQELTLRCTDHLEILKKYFQMLQEDSIDNIFITEENALDMLENHSHETTMLKPAATETYIEIAMLSETVHFLKNSMAKKLDKPRFRGMLWFDISLLPELVCCQERMTTFSFLKDNSTDCLWKVIETAISELKKDLDILYQYNEAVNCSYALRLLSRELEELSEIKKLLKKSKYSVPMYIDFVPCIASINYGNTVTELEYNYDQFSTLLKNITATPRKDIGKMAHIMKVMKTIEHMKVICAKDAKLTISFILCQMLHNERKTFQVKRKEKMNVHVKPRKSINKSSTCTKESSSSEDVMKNVLDSSKKRPIVIDKCEDSKEQEKNIAVSSCKKQKINMKDVTKINKEKAVFKHPRTTKSHLGSENEIKPDSSDNQKRDHISPTKVEIQRSLPGSLLPVRNLKDICTSKSEDKIDLTKISSNTSEDFTSQQRNLSSTKKRNVNFSVPETKSDKKDDYSFSVYNKKNADGTVSKVHEVPSQKFLKNCPNPTEKTCPSDIKPGIDPSLLSNATVPSKPVFHIRDIHRNLEKNDTVVELQHNEILNSSFKNSACTGPPESIIIQNKVPTLQVNKTQPEETESEEKYMKDTPNSSTLSIGASGNITLNVNQTADNCFSEQQNNENSVTQNAAAYWTELPQFSCTPIYNSSERSFGTSYPYYTWCVYHYSSSNGNSITQTYQGITSYEVQPPPPGMLTTVASVQNTHSNIMYSQYFGYFSGEPQTNDFVPVSGYFQSQMPVSYNFQQPIFSQCASHQPSPQAAYPYRPGSGVLPEIPWTYAPWQQEPFQPRH
ncbi:PREDICTED: testis-expressed sequence 15 protein [Condylura cristata]|uniref:testis-expressed sequence 15 protein n=1 Tax=Condylura cristata TaxID=143302 RepID=UPI00064337CF|nr:PREDICTED: testis-expressed sequence 15 protein [Condylura cristata]